MGATLVLAASAAQQAPSSASHTAAPPKPTGFFPLDKVHRGMHATAWTVFTGTKPEPMDVEILGILKGARGPGQDMILAQLLGAKPEYTGVVAGMSGSPVYIGDKLLGSLSYRIGQFSKDPIAGITPIAQMLEVRDLPLHAPEITQASATGLDSNATIQAMDTPLVMSGFAPDAVRLWQQKMAGTPFAAVSAGGIGGSTTDNTKMVSASAAGVEPGSAVSAQLVRGDMEIAATCTVTYIDPKQLLACGHPILQAGPISVPMTTAEVVATLASPLNAFKIINTGVTIGSFTEDRDSAIRGVLGEPARMIPVHITINGPDGPRKLHVDVLNLESLTAQAFMVVVYNSLLQSNQSTAEMSYHVSGRVDLQNYGDAPIDVWAPSGATSPAALTAALQTGLAFQSFYGNDARRGSVTAVNLTIDAIPHHVDVNLDTARIVSADEVHAGDTVTVEATLRPWHQPVRNVRIPFKLPTRLSPGNLRLLISDAGTLDRALVSPRMPNEGPDMETVLSEARLTHAADRVYVSLLVPETQAEVQGDALSTLPMSMANALEPMKATKDANLNGESAIVAASAPGGGVVQGFTVLTLHVVSGGGLN
ncbi:MAG: SpoIVB peptidase S55 [Acidobacteriota bacterium]|nr:SpoIVB peptidase S55 [Acidobacteriota bacterium]